VQVFSTNEVAERDRFAYWRDVLTQHFIHLRPEPIGCSSFSSEIHARELGGHSFSEVCAGGQRVHRTRSEIARSPYDLVFLNLQIRGRGSYRQGGEEIALGPGDLFLIDAVEPFELGCAEPLAQISLKVPRLLFNERAGHSGDVRGAFVAGTSYVGRLLGSYVETLWRDDRFLDKRDVVDDLVRLTTYELDRRRRQVRVPREAVRAGLYARARQYIGVHARRAGLAPGNVARALGVSLRTLQVVFAEQGDAVARSIQAARLALAAQALADPGMRHRRIGEIAFAAGFSELSHFTHAFSRAHGEPPGAWRRRRMLGG